MWPKNDHRNGCVSIFELLLCCFTWYSWCRATCCSNVKPAFCVLRTQWWTHKIDAPTHETSTWIVRVTARLLKLFRMLPQSSISHVDAWQTTCWDWHESPSLLEISIYIPLSVWSTQKKLLLIENYRQVSLETAISPTSHKAVCHCLSREITSCIV